MAITAKNKANEREVEMMVGKAMCAYANWKTCRNDRFVAILDESGKEVIEHMYSSEYEATCRCIAMFTVEYLPEVCKTIIDRAKSEFGI